METCREAVKFAKDSGDCLLIVSGGEPTEHPKFFECCRIVNESGLRFSVCSNGMFMGNEKKEWAMEKVANLSGFCGGQIYTNPKWYPLHAEITERWKASGDRWSSRGLVFDTTDIRGMQDIGRAKSNPYAMEEAKRSPYHNLCLTACVTLAQGHDSSSFFQLMLMQKRFCTPMIDWEGNVHMSESLLCPSQGNVMTDRREEIWDKMRKFRPCGGCLGCKRYLTENTPKMEAAREVLGQRRQEDAEKMDALWKWMGETAK